MTNISVRIDENVKKEAETLFEKLGISMSAAINVFFRQAIREQAIPFKVAADPFYSESNMARLKESIAQMERGEVVMKTMAELEAMANE